MKITIEKESLALFSIVIVFFIYRYANVNISSLLVMLSTAFLALLNVKYFFLGFGKTVFLLFAAVISLHGLFEVRGYYDVFKDFWYFLNPIFLFLFGFLIADYINNEKKLIWVVICTGLFFSISYLLEYVNQLSMGVASYKEIRDEIGKSSYISVIAFSLIWIVYPNSGRYCKLFLILTSLVIGVSIYFTFSRTMWFMFFTCLLLINFKILQRDLKSKIYYSSIAISLLFFFVFVIKDTAFYDKFVSTFSEISSKQNWTLVDINERWRAYESFRAFQVYGQGSVLQIAFGYGAGYLLDLKVLIELGDKGFRYIPVLHNGFAFLLLKSGFFGLFSYCLFFFVNGRETLALRNIFYKNSILCLLLILLITTYVISGLYNKSSLSQTTILLGILISLSIKSYRYDSVR